MKHSLWKPRPTRITLAAQFEDVQETDAGWVFSAWAQLYEIVNDRIWIFGMGSFAETIRQRVAADKIKVHDGHPWPCDSTDRTAGRVLSAEEMASGGPTGRGGTRYQGFLNRNHAELASKMADRTITQNSVEIVPLRTDPEEVELGRVPDHVRAFAQPSSDGKVWATRILEAKWLAVGLVSGSSQDENIVIEPPALVSYQDLPVTLGAWDPESAAARVSEWAAAKGDRAAVCLSRAHLVALPDGTCLGQIADVDEQGHLVANAEALGAAYVQLAQRLSDSLLEPEAVRLTLAGAASQIGLYGEKIRPSVDSRLVGGPEAPEPQGVIHAEIAPESTSGQDIASPASLTNETARPTLEEKTQDAVASAAPDSAEPSSSSTHLGQAQEDEPAAAEPLADTHSTTGAAEAAAELTRLRRRIQLQRLRHRAKQGVRPDEPAGASREPSPAGEAGLV